MGIQAPAEVKYGLIHEAVRRDGNLLNISALCRIAGVSRSGYYAWLDAAPLRQSREEADSADYALVKQAYEFRGYKKGARSIYMRLLHLEPPVVMNIKKMRILTKKRKLLGLVSSVKFIGRTDHIAQKCSVHYKCLLLVFWSQYSRQEKRSGRLPSDK